MYNQSRPTPQATSTDGTLAGSGLLVCSDHQIADAIKDVSLPYTGHPKASVAISVLAGAVLLLLVGFGLWSWSRAGLALNSAHLFLAPAALGSVVGAMLGVLAAGVYQPSLLTQSVVSLMLNRATIRNDSGVQVDVDKMVRLMCHLQKLGASGFAVSVLAFGAVASLCLGAGVAWLQWPGMTAFVTGPMIAGISVASAIFGIIGASLFGVAALVAGKAGGIRVHAAIALARLRGVEKKASYPCVVRA